MRLQLLSVWWNWEGACFPLARAAAGKSSRPICQLPTGQGCHLNAEGSFQQCSSQSPESQAVCQGLDFSPAPFLGLQLTQASAPTPSIAFLGSAHARQLTHCQRVGFGQLQLTFLKAHGTPSPADPFHSSCFWLPGATPIQALRKGHPRGCSLPMDPQALESSAN